MKKLLTIFLAISFLLPSFAEAAIIDDLISYWKLDETGGTREDIHGPNDLTDNNTVGNIDPGIISLGADFIAANSEYLSIEDGAQSGLDPANGVTVQAWVKLKADSNNTGMLVAKASGDPFT